MSAAVVKRRRAYGPKIDQAFDRSKHGPAYRRHLRRLYRVYRRDPHSSPFSARAEVFIAILDLADIASEAER